MLTTFYGAKGGVGTSVTAAAFALHLAATGRQTRLVDTTKYLDLWPILGQVLWPILGQQPADEEVAPNLTLGICPAETPGDEVVMDCGTNAELAATGERIVMVIRNDYLGLLRVRGRPLPLQPARVVLIVEPNRALTEDDVEAVLGLPMTVLQLDPAVSRTVDAGVLAARLPKSLSRAMAQLGAVVSP